MCNANNCLLTIVFFFAEVTMKTYSAKENMVIERVSNFQFPEVGAGKKEWWWTKEMIFVVLRKLYLYMYVHF